jgi:hypothetical protein
MIERNDSIIRGKSFRYAFISRSISNEMPSISSTGSNRSFSGSRISNESNDSLFSRPSVLRRLANFILEVQVIYIHFNIYYYICFSSDYFREKKEYGKKRRH